MYLNILDFKLDICKIKRQFRLDVLSEEHIKRANVTADINKFSRLFLLENSKDYILFAGNSKVINNKTDLHYLVTEGTKVRWCIPEIVSIGSTHPYIVKEPIGNGFVSSSSTSGAGVSYVPSSATSTVVTARELKEFNKKVVDVNPYLIVNCLSEVHVPKERVVTRCSYGLDWIIFIC